MSTGTRQKAYLALFITSTIWGTTWIGSKLGIQGVHPVYYSGLRQMLAGSLFLLVFAIRGKMIWPSLRQFGYLLLMTLLLFVFSNALTVWSLKYLNSGLGAILGAIFPLWIALFDWALGDKDKPNLLSTAGLVLGLVGVVIIFSEKLSNFSNPGFLKGILLMLIATLSWAAGTVVMTRKTIGLDRYYSLGWQMLLAGIILNLISILGGWATPLHAIPAITWWSLAYMVLFGSALAFVAFVYTVQHLPTTLASVYAYINPIVAVVLGHYLLREEWSWYLLVGAIVTLIGVYMVNSGFRKYMRQLEEEKEQTEQ